MSRRSLTDSRGVPVSTRNPASLARLESATALTASYFVDPLAEIDAALAEDPDLVMGHCLKAGLAVMSSERGAVPMLAEAVAAVDRLRDVAHPRERAHAAAASAWLAGDFAESVRRYGEILHDYPRDLLALQVAHVGDFLLGQSTLLRDRVAWVLPHYTADVPGFGYVLGMYAFGLEETNLYRRAEETGRRALAQDARDPWAVHAVAHVMEMEGRHEEGSAWLTGRRDDWASGNGLAVHNWWHVALFALERGELARALAIYDELIRPRPSDVAYENVDASALLWRLYLRGADVGERFAALANVWAAHVDDAYYAFNDVHAVMAFVGAGRLDLADLTIARMTRVAREESRDNAAITAAVGLPIARALVAFGRGDFAAAIEDLTAVRPLAHRFGGSNAQRDVVQLTLLEAALRGGRGSLARALAAERTAQKPESPLARLYAGRAVASGGEPGQAAPAA